MKSTSILEYSRTTSKCSTTNSNR